MDALLYGASEDSFVIGGASVYQALLDQCSTAYVTKIEAAFPAADCWFPTWIAVGWRISRRANPRRKMESSSVCDLSKGGMTTMKKLIAARLACALTLTVGALCLPTIKAGRKYRPLDPL